MLLRIRSLTFNPTPSHSSRMLQVYKDVELAIPEGIEVKLHARKATIKGPRGELTKVSSRSQMGGKMGSAERVVRCWTASLDPCQLS